MIVAGSPVAAFAGMMKIVDKSVMTARIIKGVVVIMTVDGIGDIVGAFAVFAVTLTPLFYLVKLVGVLKCIAVEWFKP